MTARKMPPAPAVSSVDTVLDQAVSTIEYSLRQLRDEIERIATGKAEDSKHDKASRIAFLASKIGTLVDALRKVESARKRRLEALTLPMVTAFLRTLSADERARVVREVHAMDKRGGVLG